METPSSALRRVRIERGDKLAYLAHIIGTSPGAVSAAEMRWRNVPARWLSLLPAEYALPVIGALIEQKFAEIRQLTDLVTQKGKSPGC